MSSDIDFKNVDLYELFDVLQEATEAEIKKAYRKKALKFHPDKNPDNPKAKEVFQKLSKALEVLTDKEARSSYDKILRAKKERELKFRQLDAKRRKLKDSLEAKEKIAQEEALLNEEEKLKRDIERIRKEGSRQVEEENFLINLKLEEQRKAAAAAAAEAAASSAKPNQVKIRRKTKVELTDSLIREQFGRFGTILFIHISSNGKSAIVEFASAQSLRALQADCPSSFGVEILSINETSPTTTTTTETEQPKSTDASVPKDHQDYEDFVFAQMFAAESKSNTS